MLCSSARSRASRTSESALSSSKVSIESSAINKDRGYPFIATTWRGCIVPSAPPPHSDGSHSASWTRTALDQL